jgi:hypothetical protein
LALFPVPAVAQARRPLFYLEADLVGESALISEQQVGGRGSWLLLPLASRDAITSSHLISSPRDVGPTDGMALTHHDWRAQENRRRLSLRQIYALGCSRLVRSLNRQTSLFLPCRTGVCSSTVSLHGPCAGCSGCSGCSGCRRSCWAPCSRNGQLEMSCIFHAIPPSTG